MSYEIVKGITIKAGKVYLNGADSSLRPLRFSTWKCEPLTKLFNEKGREALYQKIGEEVWNGNMHLRRGSKLCNLFLDACNAAPVGFSFSNFDSRTASGFLADMVLKLEKDPDADLSAEVKGMRDKRNDREYILECAKRTGWNFLNYADEDIQRDRSFALEVMKAGADRAWFEFPQLYAGDKEFVMEMLKYNGCFYRNLDPELKEDRDIIIAAFREAPDKKIHEHLPDLIPITAYTDISTEKDSLVFDKEFILQLLDVCPSIHLERAEWLLNKRDIALKWCEVGKWFPYSTTHIPVEFLIEKKFQDTIYSRCKDEETVKVFEQKLDEKGLLPKFSCSLDDRIKLAEGKKGSPDSREALVEKGQFVERDH